MSRKLRDGGSSGSEDFVLINLKEQVKAMLDQAFGEEHYENTILHSDQGWQYQHDFYHRFLESKGIQPSMSRKGNSPDNSMMEYFFGILKSEMFYGYEKTFKSLNQLEQAIVDYIDYYNNKRIKVKLKGLSPVQYSTYPSNHKTYSSISHEVSECVSLFIPMYCVDVIPNIRIV